ncbi:hypothetical protein KP509_16G013600 [Ceratopteris richardii]|uniref:Pentatricopeptide repeat-containing protein n=1 Tax=Ceratopteris richardii TaxID=49495 RepID=A0A8T2T0Z1_CERRI|nr:hypothetical protein KP509_16G013600 [Ceratopteris richardii]
MAFCYGGYHSLKAYANRPRKRALICNTLVSMYAKCGSLATAEIVLHSRPKSDLISWNAMLGAYVEYGCVEDAL